ncbi:M23 family metallopeptidase [Devosia algicola]|uniref:M23 family metallopeptidase n=1 Tax=Devosia algicola TaxID=3026418 RepID=A0ABY7YQ36_9HYPH|nr:M23 family metallopeptidase [Devosia algicola]WDR03434.1 M23 family metallopeptidase [Devosia algicola]
MFTVLFAGNVLMGTAFLLSPDIAAIANGQNDQIINAYEERIDQLRIEVDRLNSRSYAQAGDLNLQLQEVSQQQEVLLEQQQLVKVLVGKAEALGIDAIPPPESQKAAIDSADDASPVVTGNAQIDETARSVSAMMHETRYAMSAISQSATEKTTGIVRELDKLGITVTMPDDDELGVGGPLLPAVPGAQSSTLVDDANSTMAALVRYKTARNAIADAPVHMPLNGGYRRSSTFGNRTDPFTGKTAFHSGLDFAAATGTIVYSAGAGIVTYVGQKSGYGNCVEVTHPSGLVTRYGHLSAFLSKKGQKVGADTPIAKVGSTGRSTGPHLHFEVRRNGHAINPLNYLSTGKRLQQLLSLAHLRKLPVPRSRDRNRISEKKTPNNRNPSADAIGMFGVLVALGIGRNANPLGKCCFHELVDITVKH